MTAVLLLAILHFIPDSDDPAAIVATLTSALAPGSYLVISHLTGDLGRRRADLYAGMARRTSGEKG